VSAPATATDLVGRTLGHFKIESRLGAGGMGIVYRASDEKLRRQVALKVLPPALIGDEERRQRFFREARSAAAITHPNIATVYEIGEADGQVFIAMELVEGKTLRERLAAGPLPIDRALHLARGIARALAKAHQSGVVHRDLKPDNVMVGDDEHCKLLDFGLAKLFDSEAPASDGSGETATASGATAEGRILGTPGYMSPEQARGKAVDPRSDVFSFGVVLYEMVTGKRAFAGDTGMDLLISISRDPVPPASSSIAEVPPELDRLIARCLEKSPEARYPECSAVTADLERLTTHSSLSQRIPLAARPVRKWRRLAIGFGIAAALLAIGGSRFRWTVTRSTRPALKPMVLTDLPRPTNVKPEALAEYDAGVQKLRDDNWAVAYDHFAKAAALDPSFALAWMRYALTSPYYDPPARTQEIFRRATELRGGLGERDQLFLDALEPVILREPPDPREAARRLELATKRFPGDAELFVILGFRLASAGDWAGDLAAARRASELDPKSGDAWQSQARALGKLGRYDEAVKVMKRGIEEVPSCNDCCGDLTLLYDSQGQCADGETTARQSVLKSDHGLAYRDLAREMFVLGRPLEAVRNTLQRGWSRFDEVKRSREQARDELLLAVHAGELGRALGLAEAFARKYAADPNLRIQAIAARLRVSLLQELGREREAAQVALEFLRQRESWLAGNDSSFRDDATMVMLAAQLRAGTITPAAFSDGRRQFMARWQRSTEMTSALTWIYAWAEPAETRAQAVEAFAARPNPPPTMDTYLNGVTILEQSKVLFLAGQVDEALPGLQKAASSCRLLDEPFYVTRFHRLLGQALEEKKDVPGACAAYQWILDRWGHAKPKSVTADFARARTKALGCKP
jgi:serine/threonine-protein kinase